MEKLLKGLFDYQKFNPNAELQSVIDAVHAKTAPRKLSLEEAELINAAGSKYMPDEQKNKKEPSCR
ncbi:MAG: hypothetical protein II875_12105 [Clostridia bacterium]|nr:hypothetical protein [Clostridia bacterium]